MSDLPAPLFLGEMLDNFATAISRGKGATAESLQPFVDMLRSSSAALGELHRQLAEVRADEREAKRWKERAEQLAAEVAEHKEILSRLGDLRAEGRLARRGFGRDAYQWADAGDLLRYLIEGDFRIPRLDPTDENEAMRTRLLQLEHRVRSLTDQKDANSAHYAQERAAYEEAELAHVHEIERLRASEGAAYAWVHDALMRIATNLGVDTSNPYDADKVATNWVLDERIQVELDKRARKRAVKK